MNNKITTEFFANYLIEKIKKDAISKGFDNDFKFDFEIMNHDLPFDFDKDSLINHFKDSFLIPNFYFDYLEDRIRFTCRVLKIKHNSFETTFEPSEDMIRALRNLPNSTNF